MEDLAGRVERAKAGGEALEQLLRDYLPFLKKEVGGFYAPGLEYDDRLSLGMLVFANCVKQYEPQRGAFLSYASVCIRNRLVSEARKTGGQNTIPFSADEETGAAAPEDKAALAAYSRRREQQDLQEEIAALETQLLAHGTSFGELARAGPKQKRSRALCAGLAHRVAQDAALLAAFRQSGRLPQKELARQAGVSPKTVEKHRKYIVALLLILQGDYPGLGAYIPGYWQPGHWEVE